jgi:hypothetical protein
MIKRWEGVNSQKSSRILLVLITSPPVNRFTVASARERPESVSCTSVSRRPCRSATPVGWVSYPRSTSNAGSAVAAYSPSTATTTPNKVDFPLPPGPKNIGSRCSRTRPDSAQPIGHLGYRVLVRARAISAATFSTVQLPPGPTGPGRA